MGYRVGEYVLRCLVFRVFFFIGQLDSFGEDVLVG